MSQVQFLRNVFEKFVNWCDDKNYNRFDIITYCISFPNTEPMIELLIALGLVPYLQKYANFRYEIMSMCWKVEPTERPSFVDIHEILLSMLKNCEVRYTTNTVMFTSAFDCFFSHLTKCSRDQRAKMPCFGPRTSVQKSIFARIELSPRDVLQLPKNPAKTQHF